MLGLVAPHDDGEERRLLVPLVWERYSFQWASRVHGWRYDPWTTMPDLTAVWLDAPSP